jgi:hypothetical protein
MIELLMSIVITADLSIFMHNTLQLQLVVYQQR